MRIYFYIILFPIFYACTTGSENAVVQDSVKLAVTEVPYDTINLEIEEGDGCIFDTNIYQLTTEAVARYNSDLAYVWNSEQKEAIIEFENGDTLFLKIGGCDHFNYMARYRTDSLSFNNQALLLEKTKWIAKNFFSSRFDSNYAKFISNGDYKLEQDDSTRKYYSVNTDTTVMENEIYDGFSFEKIDGRTQIEILGYIN